MVIRQQPIEYLSKVTTESINEAPIKDAMAYVRESFSADYSNPLSQGVMPDLNQSFMKLAESINTDDLITASFQIPRNNAYEALASSIAKTLAPLLDSIKAFSEAYDYDRLISSAKEWAYFGWVIPGNMPVNELLEVPATLEEANYRASKWLDDGEMPTFNFESSICDFNKPTFEEMLKTYELGLFRSSAILCCALIDGLMISNQTKTHSSSRLVGKRAAEKLTDGVDPVLFDLFELECAAIATVHFFKSTNDFDVLEEGEFNRNFAMHGMSLKQVDCHICHKLFLILDTLHRFVTKGVLCLA